MGFLTDLVAGVRRELDAHPLDEGALLARASSRAPARDLVAALRKNTPALIAEVKRASPSAGEIAGDADPVALGMAYEAGGAAAISVLTEPRHFLGSLTDLDAIRAAVRAPLLRKDFLVHPAQVIEARAHGADAVLLITGCLGDRELAAMLAVAGDLGMSALVETHSDEELDRALASGAEIVGINARDLESLEVDVPLALERLGRVPADRIAVLESGVRTRADVEAGVARGASAILVGEALMRAGDPQDAARSLSAPIRSDEGGDGSA
jgi:indole-3-glycerol phosphate synthase